MTARQAKWTLLPATALLLLVSLQAAHRGVWAAAVVGACIAAVEAIAFGILWERYG